MPPFLRSLTLAGLLLVFVAGLTTPGAHHAFGARLQVHDLPLGGEVIRVDLPSDPLRAALGSPVAPALFAVTRKTSSNGSSALTLHKVQITGGIPSLVARWDTPSGVLYAEPVTLAGMPVAWLALGKLGWMLGLQNGDDGGAPLRWVSMCRCPIAALPHGPGADDQRRFARDLDGLPGDEIVLPFPDHAAAFRLHTHPIALEPLWRASWNPDRVPLETTGNADVLPLFYLERLAPGRDGDQASKASAPWGLIRFMGDHLLVNTVPTGLPGPYQVTQSIKATLIEAASSQGWPDDLTGALAVLTNGIYPGGQALLEMLTGGQATATDVWAPFIPHIFEAFAPNVKPSPMRVVPLSGLGGQDEEDTRNRLIAQTDMDGDGTLDLLHAKLLHAGSVFKQKNQLRWYKGVWAEGRFSFSPPAGLMESDAGSFADLVLQRRDGSPPLALLLATTEVSFSSIMKALSSQKVTLEIRLAAFHSGGLETTPMAQGRVTYHDLRTKGRRAMFLLADLNGDGRRDYLANFKEGELSYFPASAGTTRFTSPQLTHPGLPLPSHPSLVTIGDLDNDGREEVVLRYREKYHGATSHALRIIRYVP